MTNEIATNSTNTPELSDSGINDLMRQAEAMSAAHKLATVLCNTQMVPQTFRGKPDAVSYTHLTLPTTPYV